MSSKTPEQRSKRKLDVDLIENLLQSTRKQASMFVNDFYKKPRTMTLEASANQLLRKRSKREKALLQKEAEKVDGVTGDRKTYYFRDSALRWRQVDKVELRVLEKFYCQI